MLAEEHISRLQVAVQNFASVQIRHLGTRGLSVMSSGTGSDAWRWKVRTPFATSWEMQTRLADHVHSSSRRSWHVSRSRSEHCMRSMRRPTVPDTSSCTMPIVSSLQPEPRGCHPYCVWVVQIAMRYSIHQGLEHWCVVFSTHVKLRGARLQVGMVQLHGERNFADEFTELRPACSDKAPRHLDCTWRTVVLGCCHLPH